jgi:CDP-diacylglycerol--serine O-phosphatidyltransferase
VSVRGYFRAAWRDEWDGLGRITRDIRPADIVTMGNAIMGLLAIVAAANHQYQLGALLILAGILFDGLDGAVARLGGGGPLGGFLDTLADTITFALAPAVLISTGLDGTPLATFAVASFYVVCVMLRLARFEALREKKHMEYFSGMSSTGSALVVAAAFLAGMSVAATLALTLISALLMVSRVRYPKLRGGLGVTAVIVVLAVLGAAWKAPALVAPATWTMVAFMTIYLTTGPFYVLARFGYKEA